MKKILLLACLFSLFTCEKDDICAEGSAVTPQLIVSFYDETNPTQKKTVDNLYVVGYNSDNQMVTFASTGEETRDSILVPLRTDANITKIGFHRDYEIDDNDTPNDTSDDIILGNEDLIDFGYTRSDVYVSRACGFIANYLGLSTTLGPDSDNWILNTEIVKENVENEIEAHVKVYH
jgi:hypothetical protein